MAKSCTPLCVVSDRMRMCGSLSGHPVENAVTKSADVLRCSVISSSVLCRRDKGGDFDFDLGSLIDEPVDIEQCRGREVAAQGFLPGSADPGTGRLIFTAAGQVPVQPHDVLGTCAGLAEQLD